MTIEERIQLEEHQLNQVRALNNRLPGLLDGASSICCARVNFWSWDGDRELRQRQAAQFSDMIAWRRRRGNGYFSWVGEIDGITIKFEDVEEFPKPDESFVFPKSKAALSAAA